MAQQMINERISSTESIGELSRGSTVSHRMSVDGMVAWLYLEVLYLLARLQR